MDSYFQSRRFGLHHRRNKLAQREIPFAVRQVYTKDVLLMTNRPVYSPDAGGRSHAAGSDGDQANRHIKFFFCAGFGAYESFETGVPIKIVSMKSQIR